MMELMQRNLDHDLTAAEEQILLSHLAQCPDCSDLYARLKLLSEELAQLPRVMPAYSIVDAILPQLEAMGGAGYAGSSILPDETGLAAAEDAAAISNNNNVIPLRGKRGWFSWKIFSGVAAAGIVLGMVVFNGGGGIGGQKSASDKVLKESVALSNSQMAATPLAGAGTSDNAAELNKKNVAPLADGLPAGTAASGDQESARQESATAKDPVQTPAVKGETPIRDSREVAVASAPNLKAKDQYGLPEGAKEQAAGAEFSLSLPDGNEAGAMDAANQEERGIAADSTLPVNEGSFSGSVQGNEKSAEAPIMGLNAAALTTKSTAGSESDSENKAEFTSSALAPVVSPDGQYTARYKERSVTVIAKDDSTFFTSAVILAPGQTLAFIGWTDSMLFTYTITSPEGKVTTYRISIPDKKETAE
jgi:hypothetical protein